MNKWMNECKPWTWDPVLSSGNSVAISAARLPGYQVLWFSILPRQEDPGIYSNMKTELIEATQGNTSSVETENLWPAELTSQPGHAGSERPGQRNDGWMWQHSHWSPPRLLTLLYTDLRLAFSDRHLVLSPCPPFPPSTAPHCLQEKSPNFFNMAHKALHDLNPTTISKPSPVLLQSTRDISVTLSGWNFHRSQVISVPGPSLMLVSLSRMTTSFLGRSYSFSMTQLWHHLLLLPRLGQGPRVPIVPTSATALALPVHLWGSPLAQWLAAQCTGHVWWMKSQWLKGLDSGWMSILRSGLGPVGSEVTPWWQFGLELCFYGLPVHIIGASMHDGRHNLTLWRPCARKRVRICNPFEKKTTDVPLTPKSVGCSYLMRHTLCLFPDPSEGETEASTPVYLSLSSPVITLALAGWAGSTSLQLLGLNPFASSIFH